SRTSIAQVGNADVEDSLPDPRLTAGDGEGCLEGADQGGVGRTPRADRAQQLAVCGVEDGHEAGEAALDEDLEDTVGLEDAGLGPGVPVVVDFDRQDPPLECGWIVDGKPVDGGAGSVVDGGGGRLGSGGGCRGGGRNGRCGGTAS